MTNPARKEVWRHKTGDIRQIVALEERRYGVVTMDESGTLVAFEAHRFLEDYELLPGKRIVWKDENTGELWHVAGVRYTNHAVQRTLIQCSRGPIGKEFDKGYCAQHFRIHRIKDE